MLNRTLKSYFTNQSDFQGKSIIFVTSIPIPKAPMGRGWAELHIFFDFPKNMMLINSNMVQFLYKS